MFIARIPAWIQVLMPGYIWKIATREKVLYLSFDDGPIPKLTPWVLDTLRSFDARATFFCVGDNIRKHPDLFQRLLEEGHSVGNHTFHHLNGWKTDTAPYLDNVQQCSQWLPGNLFRPPYGRLTRAQKAALRNTHQIVMWDVLSGDYSPTIAPEQCLRNVVNNARRGSIIVMHDNLKAERNLRYTLPRVLEHFSRLGFRFEGLNMHAR